MYGIGENNAGTYPTVCVELDLASLAVNTIIEVGVHVKSPFSKETSSF